MGAYSQLTVVYARLPKYCGHSIADIVDGIQQKVQGMEADTYRMLVPTRHAHGKKRKGCASSPREIKCNVYAANSRARARALAPPPP